MSYIHHSCSHPHVAHQWPRGLLHEVRTFQFKGNAIVIYGEETHLDVLVPCCLAKSLVHSGCLWIYARYVGNPVFFWKTFMELTVKQWNRQGLICTHHQVQEWPHQPTHNDLSTWIKKNAQEMTTCHIWWPETNQKINDPKIPKKKPNKPKKNTSNRVFWMPFSPLVVEKSQVQQEESDLTWSKDVRFYRMTNRSTDAWWSIF